MPLDIAEPGAAALVTLAAASLACLAAAAVALWLIVVRLRRMQDRLAHLDRLEPIQTGLTRLSEARGELDLRRLEHVLIDIRDGQKRVEDRMLAVMESSRATSLGGAPSGAMAPLSAGSAAALGDRIVTRLLALGYERVQLVTPIARIAETLEGEGEILVEARREGAACKGRVLVRRGAIADVQIQSAYSTFP